MKETRGAATVELALLSGINEWSVDQVSELFRKCKRGHRESGRAVDFIKGLNVTHTKDKK